MIAENLEAIYAELPQGVRLVAVSKFHPVPQLLEAYAMGQRAFGENRPQELAAKAVQMPPDVEWHFIGHLQTNKLKLVLPYARIVESVDSVHLLDAIQDWAARNDRVVRVLLEVHIGAEETKQGFTPEEVLDVLTGEVLPLREFALRAHPTIPSGRSPRYRTAGVTSLRGSTSPSGPLHPNLIICGLMGMASHTDDEGTVAADFARIKSLFDRCRAEFPELAEFTELSIGMSDDWRIALRHGSTEVRIGTAIFGPR